MTAPAAAPTPQTGANPQSVKVTITEDTVNGTEYVILALEDSQLWMDKGVTRARDRDQAVEKYAAAMGNKGGTFVAISKSKFKPVKVTPETVTTLKLEEAKS